jgi:hypothetical protein
MAGMHLQSSLLVILAAAAVHFAARTAPMLARLSAIFGSRLPQRPQTGGLISFVAPTAKSLQTRGQLISKSSGTPSGNLHAVSSLRASACAGFHGPLEVFRFAGLAWVQSSVDAARSATAGLFRFRSDFATHYILIEKALPSHRSRRLSAPPALFATLWEFGPALIVHCAAAIAGAPSSILGALPTL